MPEEINFAQALYPLNADSPEELRRIITLIGADPRSNAYFMPKRRVRHIYSPDVDYRAAAFLKQELLARGGDVVVARHVIDGKANRSGILIMGTDGQLAALLQKMKSMDCWGLEALRTNLAALLKNTAKTAWTFQLPDGRSLLLNGDTKLMGILNLTPDSFHAPSRQQNEKNVLDTAETMLKHGADILDLGAESTRPGSIAVTESEELERLIPTLKAVRKEFPQAILSVDTYKGKTALAAAEAGADIINDVGGFELDDAMLECAAKTNLPYVLSHIKGKLADMLNVPPYQDILSELFVYFKEKIEKAELAGIARERIIIDPGLGFAKNKDDNLLILKHLESLQVFGCPILIGHSRKRFTASVADEDTPDSRLLGTTAISALLYGRVPLLRVHDIEHNRKALNMARSIQGAE